MILPSHFSRLMLAMALLGGAASGEAQPKKSAEELQGYQSVTAAIHIHSTVSNGDHDIAELADRAAKNGLDVLAITDSFLTEARYGLWPFRKLLSRTHSRPGILDYGVDRYLESIRAANRRQPNLVILAGAEVTPFYFWRGSPLEELELHQFDRHLLVLGLENVDSLARLPVIGNERWSNTRLEPWRLAGPACLVLIGIFLLRFSRNGANLRTGWIARGAGLFLVLIAIAWLWDGYPFGSLGSPYEGRHDPTSYQRLIDYVRDQGGLTFWSYPEARYPDVRSGGARMIHRPHPEDLAATEGYTGFEGLYGDRITVINPGGAWDRLLIDYLDGRRKQWPSVITGIDFHQFRPHNNWYSLHRGQTLLWARSKTSEAVLEALKSGRGYATFQSEARADLRLTGYAARAEGQVALAGGILQSRSPALLTARLAWQAVPEDKPLEKARLQIVLDGELQESTEIALPASIVRTLDIGAGKHYCRLLVTAGNTLILSNPIFIDILD